MVLLKDCNINGVFQVSVMKNEKGWQKIKLSYKKEKLVLQKDEKTGWFCILFCRRG